MFELMQITDLECLCNKIKGKYQGNIKQPMNVEKILINHMVC